MPSDGASRHSSTFPSDDAPPSITCACKRPRCNQCLRCSRCGCDHDGISVLEKISRKRGGQKGRRVSKNDSSSFAAGRSRREVASFESYTGILENKEGCSLSEFPKITSISDLESAFGWKNGGIRKQLPPKHDRFRPAKYRVIEEEALRRITSILSRITERAAKLLYPGGHKILLGQLTQQLNLIPPNEGGIRHVREGGMEGILEDLLECTGVARKNSTEKRSLRAILCGNLARKELMEIAEFTSFSVSPASFSQGLKDLVKLKSGESLSTETRSIKRYSEIDVEDAVSFLLSPRYVGYLSWGTRYLVIDGRKHCFPRLSRRLVPKRIWEEYDAWRLEAGKKGISRASFLSVVKELTCDKVRLIRAVDYVTGILIDDNFNILQRIVVDCIRSEGKREEYGRRIALCKNFLKYQYGSHLRAQDPNETHCIEHGLASTREKSYLSFRNDCMSCKGPFKLADDILHDCLGSSRASEIDVGDLLDEFGRRSTSSWVIVCE